MRLDEMIKFEFIQPSIQPESVLFTRHNFCDIRQV